MATGAFSVRSGTRIGNFNIPLSFTEAVSGVGVSNLNAVAVDGNGITGVVFAVSGSGANYNIAVTLPDGQTGRFRLSLQGTVTPVGSGITEALTGNEVTIAYDTASVVVANYGTVEYREGGEIVLPVVFAEDVAYLHKTDFTLERVGDSKEVWEVIDDYWLVERVGVARTFYLHFKIAPNKRGRFSVDLTGYVYKTATVVRDDVRIDPITVAYNTTVPEIVDFDIPANYVPGETFDVILQLNTSVTFSPAPADGTFLDHFIFEGADLGTPNLYRKTDDTYPTQAVGDFPVGGNADWTQDDLTTETATIYLLRWDPVVGNPQGAFNLTLKQGAVRGPVN